MRVLAIDPGYERLGIAVLEKDNNKERVIFSDCFKTPKNIEHAKRIFLVGQKIKELLNEYSPDALATEKLFFSVNKKTALLVAETRGVILFCAEEVGVNIYEFHPSEIKLAITGIGNADKESVYLMAKKLIRLEKDKMIDDEVDAICIGLTFFAHNKY